MQKNDPQNSEIDQLLETIYRYLSFWPYFIISIIFCVLSAYVYLRYEDDLFVTISKIEILDDAMDSEMALPTEITIFNRSTINLENETEIIKSYRIISRVVDELDLNVKFFTIGRVKNTQNDISQWLNNLNFDLSYTKDLTSYNKYSEYYFDFYDDYIVVRYNSNGNEKELIFNEGLIFHEKLPFKININDNINKISGSTFKIEIHPFKIVAQTLISSINVKKIGKQSDILSVELVNANKLLARRILDNLVNQFDLDGIRDRQLVFKRTIDFVDTRFEVLKAELDTIEEKKKFFKQENDLVNIQYNATTSGEQRIVYDDKLFQSSAELEIINFLIDDISNNSNDLLPTNLALVDQGLSSLINQFNKIIIEKTKYLNNAGDNNLVIKNIDQQIVSLSDNIKNSLLLNKRSLEIQIEKLKERESMFGSNFGKIPQNEKTLRSIEREQEIKEALFLLLLQKREEAAINFAVTKPSIKIIDEAMSSINPIFPNTNLVYTSSIILGFFIPSVILFIWFISNNKIHTRKQLNNYLDDIPVIAEIPYIHDNDDLYSLTSSNNRSILSESMRMLTANLNFVMFNKKSSDLKENLILVTSSIKGEGKTIISINTAVDLTSKFEKVLLIGADLRNPQIHKFLNLSKDDQKGVSDYIYDKNNNWRDYIIKHDKLDIILSGSIPPNPAQLLASEKFKKFIYDVKNQYDYVVIDSAPCVLVSDTFEISKYVDTTLYVVRSNFTQKRLFEFINECKNEKKLTNLNIVFNSVGNSSSYGYKYGYQYGYKYAYKYGYNYGYNYGYGEDK